MADLSDELGGGLNNIAQIRIILSEIQAANKEGLGFSRVNEEISQARGLIRQFLNLQLKVTQSATTTESAFKKQAEILKNVSSINREIDSYTRSATAAQSRGFTLSEQKLKGQASILQDTKVQLEAMAEAYGTMAEESLEIDKNTLFFTKLSDVVQDIRGIRRFAEPFKEAAKASRETSLANQKISAGVIPGSKKNVLISGIGGFMKGLAPLLAKFASIATILKGMVSIVEFFVDAMFKASKQVAEFQKGLTLSRKAAQDIRQRFFEISDLSDILANTQGKISITQEQLVQSQGEFNKLLGIQIDFTQELGTLGQKLLVQSAIYRDNWGLSTEAIGEFTREALRTNKPLEDIVSRTAAIVSNLGLQDGLLIDAQSILEETAKLSGEVRNSFGGSTEEIAKGVYQLKLMGMTLEQSKKSASGLLDFQSSIRSEIEAELLTGQQLNLEQARLFALKRDYKGVGEEIMKQVGSYEDLTNMNILAVESLAKAVGMTGDELTESVRKVEELSNITNLTGANVDNLGEKYIGNLRDLYNSEKFRNATERDRIKMLQDQIDSSKRALNAQDKFNQSLTKAQEIFSRFVDGGVLDSLAEGLAELTNSSLFSSSRQSAVDRSYNALSKEDQEKYKSSYETAKSEPALRELWFAKLGDTMFDALGVGTSLNLTKDIETKNKASMDAQKAFISGNLNSTNVDDFIIRPGQAPIKYNKDDIIMGGTKLDKPGPKGQNQPLNIHLNINGHEITKAIISDISSLG